MPSTDRKTLVIVPTYNEKDSIRSAVEDFRFSDLRVYLWADPNGASGEVRARGRMKETRRAYEQEYVFFLRATGGRIAWLREYFDPTRAAKALDRQIT